MSKGAVGLVAGYWPEDIYRYLGVPGLSLDDAIVARPARRRADRTAVTLDGQALTYRELAQEMERTAKLLRGALRAEGNRLALAVGGELELARLFVGALKARCVLLLLDPQASPDALRLQLGAFRPDLLIADEPLSTTLAPASEGRWRTLSAAEFWQAEVGASAAAPRMDLKAASVALVGPENRLVYHSHSSLVGWAVSWSAFVPLSEESVVLTLEPLFRWGGLVAALPVLFRGATCVFASPQSPAELADLVDQHHPDYLVLPLPRASALAASGRVRLGQALGREGVQGAFVTVESPFAVKERRRIEANLGLPALTLLGSAAAGPALASHPTWYLHDAVGIPVTNVDVWPLNPATRNPLAVPWEAIEYGEIGARSPMVAADYQTPQDRDLWVSEDWVRMGMVANMDPNGLFYLHR